MGKSGLPKQYAKMGFGPGWRAYKRSPAYRAKHGKSGGSRPKAKKKAHKAPARPAHHPKKKKHASVPAVVHHHPKKGSSSMKVSKSKMAALMARVKGHAARLRKAKSMDLAEVGLALGEGLAGGVASSYAFGMIPVPASLPKPAAIKSAAQMASGIGLAVMMKNKHIRYAGMGMAMVGGMGLLREIFPIPTMAGEVDASMFGEPDPSLMGWNGGGMGEPLGEPLGGESSWSPHGD